MYEEGLAAEYGELVFETRVTEAVEYVEAFRTTANPRPCQ